MVFKRRNPRTYLQWFREGIYPRSGWKRATNYVMHRIKRMPDTPHRIAVGVAAGIFVTFTPFFGLHFFLAALLAFVLRGNVLVSLAATFFGNPITFPIIGIISHRLGLILMGRNLSEVRWPEIRTGLVDFVVIPWRNFKAIFTTQDADWMGFERALDLVIIPYLVGGFLPGLIFAGLGYFISKPLVRAYQNRRKGRMKKKIVELREAAVQRFEKKDKDDEE